MWQKIKEKVAGTPADQQAASAGDYVGDTVNAAAQKVKEYTGSAGETARDSASAFASHATQKAKGKFRHMLGAAVLWVPRSVYCLPGMWGGM